jgi:DNA recombination protein RmuC
MIIALLVAAVVLNLVLLILLWTGHARLEKTMERLEQNAARDFQAVRLEQAGAARDGRTELQATLQAQAQTNLKTWSEMSSQQRHVLDHLLKQLEQTRQTMEQRLSALQEDNNRKLEQMRGTVEEKLQTTLEQRLGESFKQVSERLEQVHKGLGEMQSLANGVGDLKKVLVNVKARGIMGEIQLSNLLEHMLSAEQYETNVQIRSSSQERVEFAVKLPAKEEARGFIYLPLDSKFPIEDYQRLVQAQEDGDRDAELEFAKKLEKNIRAEAKKIQDKYVHPPGTTDFAVMFLPFEGLYAEVLRRPGLLEQLQRECRVVITGPSTLAALLNSLQMGFRTLAIQKRSSEVWQLLGAVKSKFGEFAGLLEKAHKKIEEAGRSIETAGRSTRQIEKKLARVQQLDEGEAAALLPAEELADSITPDEE